MAKLNPYLNFKDNARDAIEFYKTVFGGKLTISTFGENHMSDDPSDAEKVMHAQLDADNGFTIMASDTPAHMEATPGRIANISISGDSSEEEELKGYWEKLSVDAQNVNIPLDKAPWGDTFGMLTDKFGVEWMVNIAGSHE